MKNNNKIPKTASENATSDTIPENIYQHDKLESQELSDTTLDVISGGLGPDPTAIRMMREELEKNINKL